MPRDYKSRSRRSAPDSDGPSALVWLFIGVLIGLIIAGVFYLKSQKTRPLRLPPTMEQSVKKVEKSESHPKKTDPTKPQPTANTQNLQTQFDFYNVLAKQKNPSQPAQQTAPLPAPVVTTTPVATATAAIAPVVQATPTTVAQASAPLSKYMVQVAVFSKFSDADQLKAQLILLGFEVRVSPVQKNGQTLQRVWLGPFKSQAAATSVQKQLKQNQITSSVLKIGA